jgi:hypothetical protein
MMAMYTLFDMYNLVPPCSLLSFALTAFRVDFRHKRSLDCHPFVQVISAWAQTSFSARPRL